MAKKNALKKDVASLRSEIVQWMANHSNGTLDTPAGQGDHDQMRSKFERYTLKMMEYHSSRDEIEWTMLSACEFVNSVATTTGRGALNRMGLVKGSRLAFSPKIGPYFMGDLIWAQNWSINYRCCFLFSSRQVMGVLFR